MVHVPKKNEKKPLFWGQNSALFLRKKLPIFSWKVNENVELPVYLKHSVITHPNIYKKLGALKMNVQCNLYVPNIYSKILFNPNKLFGPKVFYHFVTYKIIKYPVYSESCTFWIQNINQVPWVHKTLRNPWCALRVNNTYAVLPVSLHFGLCNYD